MPRKTKKKNRAARQGIKTNARNQVKSNDDEVPVGGDNDDGYNAAGCSKDSKPRKASIKDIYSDTDNKWIRSCIAFAEEVQENVEVKYFLYPMLIMSGVFVIDRQGLALKLVQEVKPYMKILMEQLDVLKLAGVRPINADDPGLVQVDKVLMKKLHKLPTLVDGALKICKNVCEHDLIPGLKEVLKLAQRIEDHHLKMVFMVETTKTGFQMYNYRILFRGWNDVVYRFTRPEYRAIHRTTPMTRCVLQLFWAMISLTSIFQKIQREKNVQAVFRQDVIIEEREWHEDDFSSAEYADLD